MNHIIAASPEGATGTVDMLMIDLNGDPYQIRHEGHDEDTYVCTPQGWRFKSSIHHVPTTTPPAEAGQAAARGATESGALRLVLRSGTSRPSFGERAHGISFCSCLASRARSRSA